MNSACNSLSSIPLKKMQSPLNELTSLSLFSVISKIFLLLTRFFFFLSFHFHLHSRNVPRSYSTRHWGQSSILLLAWLPYFILPVDNRKIFSEKKSELLPFSSPFLDLLHQGIFPTHPPKQKQKEKLHSTSLLWCHLLFAHISTNLSPGCWTLKIPSPSSFSVFLTPQRREIQVIL